MPRGLAVHLAERTVPAEADAVPRPAIHLAQRAIRAEAMMIMSPAVHLAEGAVPAEAHVVGRPAIHLPESTVRAEADVARGGAVHLAESTARAGAACALIVSSVVAIYECNFLLTQFKRHKKALAKGPHLEVDIVVCYECIIFIVYKWKKGGYM